MSSNSNTIGSINGSFILETMLIQILRECIGSIDYGGLRSIDDILPCFICDSKYESFFRVCLVRSNLFPFTTICSSCRKQWQKTMSDDKFKDIIRKACFARSLVKYEPTDDIRISVPRTNGGLSPGKISHIRISQKNILHVNVEFGEDDNVFIKTLTAKSLLELKENVEARSYLKQLIESNKIITDDNRKQLMATFEM